MSRLDELIAELCPDGVEFRAIGQFGAVIRGNGLQKKDFTRSGVGCIRYEANLYSLRNLYGSNDDVCVTELART